MLAAWGDSVLPVDGNLPTVGFSNDSIVAVEAHVKMVNLAGGPGSMAEDTFLLRQSVSTVLEISCRVCQ